ncbi:iron chaperone [Cohnella sp. GCM10012308]|uniref:iron chaperone n=1 Tax=Cohnella sp. GCM10012308 TaxID=3317329 RepID=UPI003614DE73
MDVKGTSFASTEDYIATFPPEIQRLLQDVRETIRSAAPEAKEKISYQMPTFDLHGNLVHFAAFKNHIGFYPGADGIAAFKEELSAYKGAKGSVQFPLDKPLPHELISRITAYRVIQNKARADAKRGKKA